MRAGFRLENALQPIYWPGTGALYCIFLLLHNIASLTICCCSTMPCILYASLTQEDRFVAVPSEAEFSQSFISVNFPPSRTHARMRDGGKLARPFLTQIRIGDPLYQAAVFLGPRDKKLSSFRLQNDCLCSCCVVSFLSLASFPWHMMM